MQLGRFSRVGFILAAAGSAVGLGNVWKFPYMTGSNGGGAFVMVYLLTILGIGVTLFLAEVAMGRLSRKDPVSAFTDLAPSGQKAWKFAGFIIIIPVLIVSFYTIVMGWLLKYIVVSFSTLPTNSQDAGAMFGGMITSQACDQIIYFTIAFAMTFFIVSRGLIQGIEKANIILMPMLFVILFGLMLYAMSLDGFGKAVSFLFVPDFSKLSADSVLAAVGQAFFTLSLGVGTIMTYASALPERDNLFKSSVMVAGLDTLIALIAGIMIFSFTFHYGLKPSEGAGLIFVTLPSLFSDMGILGNILSLLLFIALAFAGITSAISMIEPSIAFMENKLKYTRLKSLSIVGFVIYVLGIMALLSNVEGVKEYVTYFGTGFFDILDKLTSMILMPIGGILISIFVGFVMDKGQLKGLLVEFMGEKLFNIWLFLIRFVVPISILAIMINKFFV
ncbi:MAG: sodium-dependent transporter [Proteobacteria bacterium]|nr:MAG: sodium-dependent transporter [Pseudomonadota bacterium]